MTNALIRLVPIMEKLYPDVASSTFFVNRIGMDAGRILPEQKASTRWFFIVDEAEKAGLVRELFEVALMDYPKSDELRELWAEAPPAAAINALPLLIVAIGDDAALSLDLAALRAVRVQTGMEFTRIQDATLEKLKVALDRERAGGRKSNVHLAVHSSPSGIELGGRIIGAVALSEILEGVQVLLIAGCESDQIGDFLGVVPFVVSMSEAVSHTDAAMFAQMFWTGIGNRLSPAVALREALNKAPSGMQEFVSRRSNHGIT